MRKILAMWVVGMLSFAWATADINDYSERPVEATVSLIGMIVLVPVSVESLRVVGLRGLQSGYED